MKIKNIAYDDNNHHTIVTIDIEGTQDAAYYVLRTALAFFQNNDGLFYGVNIDKSAHEAIFIAHVGTPTEYSHEESVNKVRQVFEKAIKDSAPTNTIPIDKAKSAICKACGRGVCGICKNRKTDICPWPNSAALTAPICLEFIKKEVKL